MVASCDDWHGCYDDSWRGLITADAFAHPAKMAHGLLSKIISHVMHKGWIDRGSTVVDPFGGIGSTGILGASAGLRVICVELEAHFAAIADANFARHKALWEATRKALPCVIQGDSRRLAELIGCADADMVISSPPYLPETDRKRKHEGKAGDSAGGFRNFYSDNPANLGNPVGANGLAAFWSSAREIVCQCHAVLRTGGHAIWVTKDFVRKFSRVDFSDGWVRMCEASGFQLVCRHRAMLVSEQEELDLFAGTTVRRKGRKSFFRRLAEKRGAPAIDYEDVACFVKV